MDCSPKCCLRRSDGQDRRLLVNRRRLGRADLRLLGAILSAALLAASVAGLVGEYRLQQRLAEDRMRTSRALAMALDLATRARTRSPAVLGRDELLAEASNRVALAEARYEAERRTHEPLRRQIEQMQAREIRLTADLAARDERIAAADRGLAEVRARVDALAASNSATAARADALAAEKDQAIRAQAELRAELEKWRADAAAQRKLFDEAQARVAALDAALQSAKKTVSSLSNELTQARQVTPPGSEAAAPRPSP